MARRTDRRGFLGRGANVLFGALAGAAAGMAVQSAQAGVQGTVCSFPGPASGRPCPCNRCQDNGVCGKPCVILTYFYASGCWADEGYTCCDCVCPDYASDPDDNGWCGCGSDYHNDPQFCPN